MKKIFTLIIMLFMYMLPALTTPVYAESHVKAADATATTADVDTKKKKKAGEEEEEEEEPECD